MTKAAATSAMRLTSTFTAERMSNVTAGDVIATGCTPSDSFAFVVDTVSGSWLDNCMPATTNPTNDREVTMRSTTFAATVSATSADDAIARVTKQVAKVAGFELTGRVEVRSARHQLWNVEVANHGGDRNDLWVVLTSYGISPAKSLGSMWQTVAGVGA